MPSARSEARSELEEALGIPTARERAMLVLRYPLDDLSEAQVAEMLGLFGGDWSESTTSRGGSNSSDRPVGRRAASRLPSPTRPGPG